MTGPPDTDPSQPDGERAALRAEARALASNPQDRAEAQRVLADMNAAFEELRHDPLTAAQFDAETAAWDVTSADGLTD